MVFLCIFRTDVVLPLVVVKVTFQTTRVVLPCTTVCEVRAGLVQGWGCHLIHHLLCCVFQYMRKMSSWLRLSFKWHVRKLLICHLLLKLIESLWLVISVYCRDSDLWLMSNTHLFPNWSSSARSPASEVTTSHVISTSSTLMSSSVVGELLIMVVLSSLSSGISNGYN